MGAPEGLGPWGTCPLVNPPLVPKLKRQTGLFFFVISVSCCLSVYFLSSICINDTILVYQLITRMTACDGLSFIVFTTSLDLRRSLGALGHSLPKSVSGVRDQVVKYRQQLREDVKRSIHISKSEGEYFSLTLDEWSSVQNKRYLNINIHGNGFFWNLGSYG